MVTQGKVGGASFGLGGGKADLLLWKGLMGHSATRSTDGQPASPPVKYVTGVIYQTFENYRGDDIDNGLGKKVNLKMIDWQLNLCECQRAPS